jgi:anaerobic selenocysteine-containing dehydrogenase
MKRREFIILTGLGATSATMLSACGHPENKLIPALIPDDEYVPGLDYWKASTCHMCPAGCGIVVRTREHKANKIEGNPLHPVNRGALCALGQAGIQALYNPDRIRRPLKRTGERGSGEFIEITWDEAIKTLADKLREMKSQGRAASSAFITGDRKGLTAHVAERFMQAYGARAILLKPLFNDTAMESSYESSYGGAASFDIANATYLLSFGARFLETWHSPVMYSLAYGEFRRTSGKARGKLVQVEPRMSLTGANADEWLPASVDTEALVALAIAQVIIREGLVKDSPPPEFINAIQEYAPEKTAERTDVAAEKVIRIAREFATAERPLAIGGLGGPGARDHMKWVNFLNTLAGNLNKKGGVILSKRTDDYHGPLERLRPAQNFLTMHLRQFPDFLMTDNPSALLIHQSNPLYAAPSLKDKLNRVPFIASFSSFMDETTQLADLVLPDHSYLERWDINSGYPTSGGMVVTLTQPVVKAEFDTRQTADVLLGLSRELGGDVAASLPFASAEEIVKQAAVDLIKARGSLNKEKPEESWETFVERGLWIDEAGSKTEAANISAAATPPKIEDLNALSSLGSQQSSNAEYPLMLLIYEHATFGDGSSANLPWIQELPDAMTTVMWGSWVEINPKTAARLGINDGDLVEVATTHGSVRAGAVLYPAIRPDVIAMPYGQGHTAYGRYAEGRGANVALLNPLEASTEQATPVSARVSKAQGEAKLIRFGTELLERVETDRSR